MSDDLAESLEEAPLSERVGSFVADLLEELQTEENRAERLSTLKEFMKGYLQISQLLEVPALCYTLAPEEAGFRDVICGHTMHSAVIADWQILQEDLTSRLNEAHVKKRS